MNLSTLSTFVHPPAESVRPPHPPLGVDRREDMDKIERWRPIPGWDGWYSISSLGRVRSEHRKIVRSDNVVIVICEKPRKVITWPNGRKTVRLRRDGQQFTVRIDRLMAELFGGGSD